MYHSPDDEGYFSSFEDDDNPGGTGDQDPVLREPPAGFIPRQFLEPIEHELTDEECDQIIRDRSFLIFDAARNEERPPTREELRAIVTSTTGVRDIRTGEERPNISGVPMRIVHLGGF